MYPRSNQHEAIIDFFVRQQGTYNDNVERYDKSGLSCA